MRTERRSKTMTFDGRSVLLTLHDTPGAEDQTNDFYSSMDGVLIIYDVTDSKSFEAVKGFVDRVRRACSKWTTCLIVGNKSDLETRRKARSF